MESLLSTVEELSLEDKKHLLIEGLKEGYRARCNAVQPIPYVKNLYNVNNVSVEGDIRFLKKSEGKETSWERLDSYSTILKDHRVKSRRIIIQADSGYGKTFLSLRFAHNWYTRKKGSPLSDIEILIVLKLGQLGATTSIYRAIRRFLLPKGIGVRFKDIEQILNTCKSVLVILDGYDEFRSQNNALSDVNRVMMCNMLPHVDVILTGRYLPREFDRSITSIVGLYGFDEETRDEYIRKAITGADTEEFDRIKHELTRNPVLEELCLVPLLFVAFAHMTDQRQITGAFDTVRQFFSQVIRCFHNHTRIKTDDLNVKEMSAIFEKNMDTEINRLALESLKHVGRAMDCGIDKDCYEHFTRIGILVEEEVMDASSGDSDEDNFRTSTTSRFCHKLFCEWYASFHLATLASVSSEEELKKIMDCFDPVELQYLYRFACGRSLLVGKQIIERLIDTKGGIQIIPLCLLERVGSNEDVIPAITKLCSNGVEISRKDNRLYQKSSIQLLEMGVKFSVPISVVILFESFHATNDDGERCSITLQSGVSLPPLVTLKSMFIATEYGVRITEDDANGLLKFSEQCRQLQLLRLQFCEMPSSFTVSDSLIHLKSRGLKVVWMDCGHQLQLSSGQWELDDIAAIRNTCSAGVSVHTNWSKHTQSLQMKLLETASSNDIPVKIWLHESYCGIDSTSGDVILQSGLPLPRVKSAEGIYFNAERGQQITQDEMMGILKYATYSKSLAAISFQFCDLPLSIPVGEILSIIRSIGAKVIWFDLGHHLDLHSGHWQMGDIEAIRESCSMGLSIYEHWSEHTQKLQMKLLEVASSNSIPFQIWLRESYCKVDATSGDVILQSNLPLPKVTSAEMIAVETWEGQSISQDEFIGLMKYASQSEIIRELRFHFCDMPLTIPVGTEELSIFKSKYAKVSWKDCGHQLNHQSGRWEMDDMEAIRESCSLGIVFFPNWSKNTHNLQVNLLMKASSTNVPVEHIALLDSFSKVDVDTGSIVLKSGVCLPRILSNEKLAINEFGREMTEEELVGLMDYAGNLQALKLFWCFVPHSVSTGLIPTPLLSNSVQVLWNYTKDPDQLYTLDLRSGKWKSTVDEQELTLVDYSNMLARFREQWSDEERQAIAAAAL